MKRAFFLVTLMVLLLLPVVGWATDWYVRPAGGNYGNEDGTSYEDAWDGFANIDWSSIQPGDTLWLDGSATYSEIFWIYGSGTAEAPITIRGDYGGGRARLDASNADNKNFCIYDNAGHDGLIFRNLELTGFYIGGFKLVNDSTPTDGCDNIQILDCEIHDPVSNDDLIFAIQWHGNNCIIRGNYFHDIQEISQVIYINKHNKGTYINTDSNAKLIIEHNRFVRCNSDAYHGDGHVIGLNGGAQESRTVKHVVIRDNVFDTCGNAGPNPIVSSYNAEDVIIQRNVFYNGSARAIQVGTNCKDSYVAYNLVYGSVFYGDQPSLAGVLKLGNYTGGCTECTTATNIYFVNNTIYGIDAEDSTHSRGAIVIACADDGELACDHIYVENNIVYADMPSDTSNCWELMIYDPGNRITDLYSDYNDWYRSTNTANFIYFKGNTYSMSQFGNYQSTEGQDADSFVSDPLLLFNYHLSHNSPCINAGTFISGFHETALDIDGQPILGTPDIGCDERKALWWDGRGWHIQRMYALASTPAPPSQAGYMTFVDGAGINFKDTGGITFQDL